MRRIGGVAEWFYFVVEGEVGVTRVVRHEQGFTDYYRLLLFL